MKGPLCLRAVHSVAKEKIKAAKTELCQQLRAIWTLPIDERNKAIKRLYPQVASRQES